MHIIHHKFNELDCFTSYLDHFLKMSIVILFLKLAEIYFTFLSKIYCVRISRKDL